MTYSDNEFIQYAKCKSTKEVDFHSENYSEIKRAISFCSDCPVKTECLNYAITNNIKHGVWGGTSAYARRKLKLNHLSTSVS